MSRVVVVTGSASGVGAALVGLLLDRGDVEVHGVDLRRPGRGGVVEHAADLADPVALDALAAELPPHLDAIAHVAGLPGTHPAARVLAVNVLAPLSLSATLVERMPTGGAIAIVSSIAAARSTIDPAGIDELIAVDSPARLSDWLVEHPLSDSAAYDTSKKALTVAAPRLAARLLPGGVRVLSVSPGPIRTPILGDFVESMGRDSIDRAAAAVGRHATAVEVAAVIDFAISPAASWLNGVDIPVDGGLGALRTAASADGADRR